MCGVQGAEIIIFLTTRDDGSPLAELARVCIGMPLADIVGLPSGRGFPDLEDDCASWESSRGVAIVNGFEPEQS